MSIINGLKKKYIKLIFIFIIIFNSLPINVLGQNLPPTKIDEIVNITHPQQDSLSPLKLNIGDYFYVQIKNVPRNLEPDSTINKNKFVLYFDSWAMNGLRPLRIGILPCPL